MNHAAVALRAECQSGSQVELNIHFTLRSQGNVEVMHECFSPLPTCGFGLTSQLRRAAVSIPSNIGEGFAPRKDTGIFANMVELSLFGINAQGKPLQGVRTALDLTLRPDTHERVKQHGLRANPRVELPPGRYQVRIGVRESGAGAMGTVFYDLDVPDFARAPLTMSGLLLSAPSAQQTFTTQRSITTPRAGRHGAPTRLPRWGPRRGASMSPRVSSTKRVERYRSPMRCSNAEARRAKGRRRSP